MARSVLTIALVLLAIALAPAGAAATPPTRAHVRELLSGYEQIPSADTWAALGPETLAVLVALYDDGSEPRYVRLRAVAVARHYPSPAARTFLRTVASTPAQRPVFVREAIRSLEAAFGPASLDDIRPYLTHDAVAVREAAVTALANIGSPEARSALRARLPDERARHVRERITRAIR